MEIKDKCGKTIMETNAGSLVGANLSCTILSGVNLRRTDLRGANLCGANLEGQI